MPTYAIGDIQGCYEPLQQLLEKIKFDPASDRLWSCGDLVNRGGKSLEVLRLLHSMGDACSVTLGNHDLHLLASDSSHPEGKCKNKEFRKILAASDRAELIAWLNGQPLAHYCKEFNVLRVHAGVVPQWTAEQTVSLAAEASAALNSNRRARFLQRMYGNKPSKWKDNRKGWSRLRLITNVLTRIRFCDAYGNVAFKLTGPPGSQPKDFRPWYRHRHRQTRDVRMVFGHWAALGLRLKKRFYALDSGCVWGGRLSAIRLEDGQLFQVPGHGKSGLTDIPKDNDE